MSNERITLTKEMLTEAKEYVPVSEKERWIVDTAPKCFDRLSIAVDDEPVPDMYMVNNALKARYLMTLLVGTYLGQEFEPDAKDDTVMSVADYDKWAGSHIVCQIERWKHDAELRDKCFDLLHDFQETKKWFSAQIMGELEVRNDTVMRQGQMTAASLKELPSVIGQLRDLREERVNGKSE